MVWELAKARRTKNLPLRTLIYIYIYTHYLSVRASNRKSKFLMKQKLCRRRPVTLKSSDCAKVHCSNNMIFNKQYEN
jgi:hypothetical protein